MHLVVGKVNICALSFLFKTLTEVLIIKMSLLAGKVILIFSPYNFLSFRFIMLSSLAEKRKTGKLAEVLGCKQCILLHARLVFSSFEHTSEKDF